jgi:hypothetical protein
VKTVIISGETPAPEELRTLVERGSTSVIERRAADLADDAAALDADRIVFWTTSYDARVKRLVERYVQAEKAQRREVLVFVTPEHGPVQPIAGLPQNECFLWPRDEDRLKMAFLTGA